ncbi:MAG: MCP four helix bundle domain-containing protein, partial [Ignavibacteriaceae bacterium]
MKWFYNLKIGTKLLMSFLLVALIAGVIGYEGITSLKAADDSGRILFERNTVPLSYLVDLSTTFQRERANLLQLLIAKAPQERNKLIKEITKRSDEMEKIVANFRKAIDKVDFQQKMNEYVNADDAFDALHEKYINLCLEGKDDEAETLWNSDLETARINEQNTISALEELLTLRAKTRADDNTIAADSSSRNMLIFLIAGLLTAIGLGLFISRIIGNPVKKLSSIADKLAIGDINVSVNAKTKDELGDLERSFGFMIENIKAQALAAEKIALGDTSVEIKAKSEQDVLSKSMIKMADTIRSLVSEALMLSKAAVEGRLSTRGKAEKFQGGYKEIVAGVNSTLDAVVLPINESGKVLEKLAQGDLTVRMTGEYQGDYSKVKDNINRLAESFSTALSEVAEAVAATASASTQISSSTEEMAAGAQEQSSQATE